jgi:hypothetical protein
MRTKDKKKLLLIELESNPLIERACKKVDIARSTFYRWCEIDLDFKKAAKEAQSVGRAKMNDFVESKLLESISSGSVQAMRFWLVHNNKLYTTISTAEIKRLRFYEGLVFELLDVATREDDKAVLRIISGLRQQEKKRIKEHNDELKE